MPRSAKLIGFLVLLAATFAGADVAGKALGPVSAGHSHVGYTATSGTSGA